MVETILKHLIETKAEYHGISYEYIPEQHSPEIGAVIFNYPGTVQLTAIANSKSFDDDADFWKVLGLKAGDKDAHYPQVLFIFDQAAGKLKHSRSAEAKKAMNRKKRERTLASAAGLRKAHPGLF